MKIGVGSRNIELNEELLRRLSIISESEYMQEQLDEVIEKIVYVYQEGLVDREYISAKEGMTMISLIFDVKRDYKFLSQLKIE